MSWSVVQRVRNAFVFSTRRANFEREAYLTYDLQDDGDGLRRLLMLTVYGTRGADGVEHPALATYKAGLEELMDQLRSYERFGRVEAAKTVVNDIADGFLTGRGYSIAVHRFGSVPVLVLPDWSMDLDLFGRSRTCRLAIFPSLRRDDSPRVALSGVRNDLQRLRSYQVGFDTVLRRYLEDVGLVLHEIELYCTVDDALSRAKTVHKMLGESLKLKLDDVLRPASPRKTGTQQLEVAKQVRTAFKVAIAEASLGYAFAQYCLNLVMETIGSGGRSHEYELRIADGQPLLGASPDLGDYAVAQSVAIRHLMGAFEQLRSGDLVEPLPPSERLGRLWLHRFVQFARFASLLLAGERDFGHSKARPWLFLSQHFEVGTAKAAATGIHEALANRPTSQLRALEVFEQRAGWPFREEIAAGIWRSCAIAPVVPATLAKVGGGESNYSWIARETELAQLLGRRVLPVVESGADTQKVVAATNDPTWFFLKEEAVRSPEWAIELNQHFTERVRLEFAAKGSGFPDANFRQQIATMADEVEEEYVGRLVLGLFRQYPKPLRRDLARLQTLPKPYPSRELTRYIPKLNKILRLRERYALFAGGRRHLLCERLVLKKSSSHLFMYRGGLREMIAGLGPGLNQTRQARVFEKVVKRYR